MRHIQTDMFDDAQWDRALQECEPLTNVINDTVQNLGAPVNIAAALSEAVTDIVADQFQLLKQPLPQYVDTPVLTLHEFLLRETEQTQEFQQLRALSEGDAANAAVGASILGEELCQRMTAAVAERLSLEATGNATPLQPGELEAEAEAIRRGMRQAANAAAGAVQDMQNAAEMFGTSEEQMSGTRTMTVEDKLKLAERVKSSRKLKDLAALAGRFSRIALQKRAQTVKEIPQEVTDITIGRDVAKALPCELVLAANPVTAPIFYERFASGKLLQYEYDAKEKLGGGPIIICLDGSGSMEGAREAWSKAIIMAYMSVAQKEKRDVMVYEFAQSGRFRIFTFPYRSAPNEVKRSEVFELVETMIDGGTDLEDPLMWAAEQIQPASARWERADIVMITDGESDLSAEFIADFNRKRETLQFNTFGILIGESRAERILSPVMDRMTHVRDLAGQTDATLDMLFAS